MGFHAVSIQIPTLGQILAFLGAFSLLPLLASILLLFLRAARKLNRGIAFILADVLIAAFSATLGHLMLYRWQRTLAGLFLIGLPSVALAAALGAAQAVLSAEAADTGRPQAQRLTATLGVLVLALAVGLDMAATFFAFTLWAGG